MPNKSLATALLQGKCPRCRTGNIFKHQASNLFRFNQMNDHCPQCGVRLEPEPGFYQGAMYVSYAFTIVFILIIGLLLYFSGDPSEWVYIGTVIGVMVLLAPLNYRYSRILFLHFFGGLKFDPSLSK
jgi:uncharacterized protein (DUF983 family)